jgi:hypothetical protein
MVTDRRTANKRGARTTRRFVKKLRAVHKCSQL